MPNFIKIEENFSFGTKFSWNEEIDICFNVECLLLGHNFDFLCVYCSLPSGYCSLLGGYCSLLGGYWWLLLVTSRCCLYQLLVWTKKTWEIPILTDRCTIKKMISKINVMKILLNVISRKFQKYMFFFPGHVFK